MKRAFPEDPFHLLHGDKNILEILNASNEYFKKNSKITKEIQDSIWIFRSLFELIPHTVENFWSGHVFPVTEAEYELESSIVFCKLGFYKNAISSLRNVLELGLLSVYWDINNKAYIDIQSWLRSREDTPFRKNIFARLSTHPNIKTFDEKQGIFIRTKGLYTKLSGFSHTKGYGYSSRKLNDHSNVNHFNKNSLNKWFSLMKQTVEIITVFHILKYPIGLQYTPMEAKFGINGPMGGFLRPDQVENIKVFISPELLKALQDLSDQDPEVISLLEWINERPDITQEELMEQLQKEDEDWIERQGYRDWLKNHRFLSSRLKKTNPDEYRKRLEYNKKLRQWAKKNNFLESGTNQIQEQKWLDAKIDKKDYEKKT
jgi:hypothetical protein